MASSFGVRRGRNTLVGVVFLGCRWGFSSLERRAGTCCTRDEEVGGSASRLTVARARTDGFAPGRSRLK